MTIWTYTIAHNEQAILPFFLRHYATVSDRIIVYDHGSTDDTAAIARSHPKVELRDYAPPQWDEQEVVDFVSRQYREAHMRADWVIWVDTDEFIYHPTLRSYLNECKRNAVNLPLTEGYTMIADEFPAGDGQLYEYCRTGVPDAVYSKPCVIDPALPAINYRPGRHNCDAVGANRGADAAIKLLHYRYFGPAWHQERNARQYSRLSERVLRSDMAYHVRPGNDQRYSPAWYAQERERRVVVI